MVGPGAGAGAAQESALTNVTLTEGLPSSLASAAPVHIDLRMAVMDLLYYLKVDSSEGQLTSRTG
jgi:hypothetical protein